MKYHTTPTDSRFDTLKQIKTGIDLGNYAEALIKCEAIEKSSNKKGNSPSKTINRKNQKLINRIKRASAKNQFQFPNYIADLLRSSLCNPDYLRAFSNLLEKHHVTLKASFTEQIKAIIEYLNFLSLYYKKEEHPYPFLNSELFLETEECKKQRLKLIGNKLVYDFTSLPPNFSILLEEHTQKMCRYAAEDIFLADAKKILRMVFEVIHSFPREERGKYMGTLPWGDNSWYLLDYCGALCVDDEWYDINDERSKVGITPYHYDHNLTKQRLLVNFHNSVINAACIIKVALYDILKNDVQVLVTYFDKLLSSIEKNETISFKMGQLPNLRNILWHNKQTYNGLRLLSLLPIDINSSYFDKDTFGVASSPQLPLMPASSEIPQSPIENGLLPSLYIGCNSPIEECPPLTQLQLSQSWEFTTLINRLAFLRKLQLIGETFIPRNLGNSLKTITIVNPENLSKIRNGLTHIEDYEYFRVVAELESNPEKLFSLHSELVSFRRSVYELIANREQQFALLERFEPGANIDIWGPNFRSYWEGIKRYYGEPEQLIFVPGAPLVTDDELVRVLNTVKQENIKKCLDILKGNVPYENVSDYYKDSLDTQCKRSIAPILKRAEKKYRQLKGTYECQEKAANTLKNKAIMRERDEVMENSYPCLKDLSEQFRKAETVESPESGVVSVLVSRLKDRLTLLYTLCCEKNLNNELGPKDLYELSLASIKSDINFSLSVAYLLGQIISILNKLCSKVDLRASCQKLVSKLPDYIALRNALEHTDPILESCEGVHFQMFSDLPKFMSSVLTELLHDFYEVLCTLDSSTLPLQNEQERLKQHTALSLEHFNYVTNPEAIQPSLLISAHPQRFRFAGEISPSHVATSEVSPNGDDSASPDCSQ